MTTFTVDKEYTLTPEAIRYLRDEGGNPHLRAGDRCYKIVSDDGRYTMWLDERSAYEWLKEDA